MKEFSVLIALGDDAFNERVAERLDQYYTVMIATDAHDVTDLIHEKQPDLAILDYSLAQMNPVEIHEGMNFLHPDTKMVLCVTDENLEVTSRVWHKRAIDYIRKPFDENRLEDDINKIVRHILDQEYRGTLRKKLAELKKENVRLKNLL